jgi:hypothetical protein
MYVFTGHASSEGWEADELALVDLKINYDDGRVVIQKKYGY